MFDVSVKTTIIGDTGVGKTCFVGRLQHPTRPIPKEHTVTIGVDHVSCVVPITDPHPLRVKFQIWDTAGQERYATLTKGFYVGTELVCLMYSCDSPESLTHLSTRWWAEFKTAPIDLATVVVLVLGNKMDKCANDADKLLAKPLARLMQQIEADTGRPPVHIRLSALKDRSVVAVLQAVAWKCVQIPAVHSAARRSPSMSLSLGKGGALVSLVAQPPDAPTTSWCCRQ